MPPENLKDQKQFIKQLQASIDIADLGELSLVGNTFSNASFQTAAITFDKPFAQIVFEPPLNQWRVPVESFRGIHHVGVFASYDPDLPQSEKMESYLCTEYLRQKGRERGLFRTVSCRHYCGS